jgi:hypothetical protein
MVAEDPLQKNNPAASSAPRRIIMKRSNKKSVKTERRIHLWTLAQAQAALPLVRSIVQSLRDSWLESLTHDQRAERLADKPGRPTRATLTAQEDERRAATRAQEQFAKTLDELEDLDIFCADPINGLAVIPFRQNDQLAWFVFDLFEDGGLKAWRYDTDPMETRHSLDEVTGPPRLAV